MGNKARTATQQTLEFLPHIGQGEPIDDSTARRVRAIIKRINPAADTMLGVQIDTLSTEARHDLAIDATGNMVLTPLQLKGIIAQSAIRGASQMLLSTAGSIEEAAGIEALVNSGTSEESAES